MAHFIKAEKSEQWNKYRLTTSDGKVYGFTASIVDDNLEFPLGVIMSDRPEVYIISDSRPGSVLDPAITDWVDVTPTHEEISAFLRENPSLWTPACDEAKY